MSNRAERRALRPSKKERKRTKAGKDRQSKNMEAYGKSVATVINNNKELKEQYLKGKKGGNCNRTACQSPKGVLWYHHSTQQYYCEECALMLNRIHRKDAFELYGHDLCTKEEVSTHDNQAPSHP